MKLRTLILFGAGIMTGLAIARKMSEDDPEVMHGPTRSSESANPALRVVTSQAQRVADRATVASLAAIKRARGAIRERLVEEPYDDVNWN
jgi:predicted dinucleotide-binding enzyme